MTDELIAFKGEMMLLNWSETKQGRNVVFLLDEESDIHPFKKFTTKKGKRAGQRFMCVLVELNDDDTPVVQEKKGGALSKSAAQLCENDEFQQFCFEKLKKAGAALEVSDSSCARKCILLKCGIDSRAELDHDPEAAKRFHELMREYREWNQQ